MFMLKPKTGPETGLKLCKTEFGRYLNGRSSETVLAAAKRGV